MKIKMHVRDVNGSLYETEYDDTTKKHRIIYPPVDDYDEICDLCSPINEEMTINGRTWTVQTDPHTKRKIGAFTKDKPFDPKRFSSDEEYQNFLNNK